MATRTLRFELPVMAGAAVLMLVLALDGKLTRVDGIILVTGAVVYTVALSADDPARIAGRGRPVRRGLHARAAR